jgi:hypothetical protein
MKIYVMEKGLTMVGKPWEIKQKLKEYSNQFETVEQWINSTQATTTKKCTKKVIWLESNLSK